jgi:hypothetical protein
MLRGSNGEVQHVKCMVYNSIQRRDMILGAKFDSLDKHVGKIKLTKNFLYIGVKKDETYVDRKCWHL